MGQGVGGVTDYTSSHLDTQTHLLYRELAHTVHCKLLLLRHGDLDVAIETGDIDRFWPVLVAFDNALRYRQGEGEGRGRGRRGRGDSVTDIHTYRHTYFNSHPFFEFGNHDNSRHIELPNHPPEVVNGRGCWSL